MLRFLDFLVASSCFLAPWLPGCLVARPATGGGSLLAGDRCGNLLAGEDDDAAMGDWALGLGSLFWAWRVVFGLQGCLSLAGHKNSQ